MSNFDSTKKTLLIALQNEIKRIEAITQQDYEQVVAKYMHEEDPYIVAFYSLFRIKFDFRNNL
jgi:predicted Zn-dependent peptidase